MARHKKTKKHSRRRRSMRGGGEWLKPWTWGKPTQQLVTTTTQSVAPMVPSPAAQAAAIGASPGGTVSTGAPILGSTAASPLPPEIGGRRRTRKRKSRRRH